MTNKGVPPGEGGTMLDALARAMKEKARTSHELEEELTEEDKTLIDNLINRVIKAKDPVQEYKNIMEDEDIFVPEAFSDILIARHPDIASKIEMPKEEIKKPETVPVQPTSPKDVKKETAPPETQQYIKEVVSKINKQVGTDRMLALQLGKFTKQIEALKKQDIPLDEASKKVQEILFTSEITEPSVWPKINTVLGDLGFPVREIPIEVQQKLSEETKHVDDSHNDEPISPSNLTPPPSPPPVPPPMKSTLNTGPKDDEPTTPLRLAQTMVQARGVYAMLEQNSKEDSFVDVHAFFANVGSPGKEEEKEFFSFEFSQPGIRNTDFYNALLFTLAANNITVIEHEDYENYQPFKSGYYPLIILQSSFEEALKSNPKWDTELLANIKKIEAFKTNYHATVVQDENTATLTFKSNDDLKKFLTDHPQKEGKYKIEEGKAVLTISRKSYMEITAKTLYKDKVEQAKENREKEKEKDKDKISSQPPPVTDNPINTDRVETDYYAVTPYVDGGKDYVALYFEDNDKLIAFREKHGLPETWSVSENDAFYQMMTKEDYEKLGNPEVNLDVQDEFNYEPPDDDEANLNDDVVVSDIIEETKQQQPSDMSTLEGGVPPIPIREDNYKALKEQVESKEEIRVTSKPYEEVKFESNQPFDNTALLQALKDQNIKHEVKVTEGNIHSIIIPAAEFPKLNNQFMQAYQAALDAKKKLDTSSPPPEVQVEEVEPLVQTQDTGLSEAFFKKLQTQVDLEGIHLIGKKGEGIAFELDEDNFDKTALLATLEKLNIPHTKGKNEAEMHYIHIKEEDLAKLNNQFLKEIEDALKAKTPSTQHGNPDVSGSTSPPQEVEVVPLFQTQDSGLSEQHINALLSQVKGEGIQYIRAKGHGVTFQLDEGNFDETALLAMLKKANIPYERGTSEGIQQIYIKEEDLAKLDHDFLKQLKEAFEAKTPSTQPLASPPVVHTQHGNPHLSGSTLAPQQVPVPDIAQQALDTHTAVVTPMRDKPPKKEVARVGMTLKDYKEHLETTKPKGEDYGIKQANFSPTEATLEMKNNSKVYIKEIDAPGGKGKALTCSIDANQPQDKKESNIENICKSFVDAAKPGTEFKLSGQSTDDIAETKLIEAIKAKYQREGVTDNLPTILRADGTKVDVKLEPVKLKKG